MNNRFLIFGEYQIAIPHKATIVDVQDAFARNVDRSIRSKKLTKDKDGNIIVYKRKKKMTNVEYFYKPETNEVVALMRKDTKTTKTAKAGRRYVVLNRSLKPTKKAYEIRNNHSSLKATYGLIKFA